MELLIVLAVIGVIMSVSMIAIGNIRESTRNTRRLSDIKQIQSALELYRANERSYPDAISTGQALIGSTSSSTYMLQIPTNPTPHNDGICPNSDYYYEGGGSGYKIDFCLSTPTGNLTAGKKCATPQGIKDTPCFVCGQDVVKYSGGPYDSAGINRNNGGYYKTALIGNQCWLANNLNVGTRVVSKTTSPCVLYGGGYYSCMTDDAVIEKYCQGNLESECDIYGALYENYEAMNLPSICTTAMADCSNSSDPNYATCCTWTTPHQGICPAGWHIPAPSEVDALILALDGSNAGGHIKEAGTTHWAAPNTGADNSSGFTALASGFRSQYDGGFYWKLYGFYMLASSQHTALPSVYYYTPYNGAYISGGGAASTMGLAVRCIKN